MVPIFFFHQGPIPYYLVIALKQAHFTNPNSKIYLITDQKYIHLNFVSLLFINDYSSQSNYHKKKYRHLSFTEYDIVLIWNLRWFIIEEYLKTTNYEQILVLDSDFLLFSDLNTIIKRYNNDTSIVSIPVQKNKYNLAASPHFSLWKSTHFYRFVNYINESYESIPQELHDKWKWHQTTNTDGGVCDMSLLYLFYKNNQKIISNALDIIDGYSIDNSMKSSAGMLHQHEYILIDRKKNISFNQKKPECVNTFLNKTIIFDGLHCQGDSKYLMFKYYQFRLPLKDSVLTFTYYIIGLIETKINRFRKRLPFKFKLGWLKKIILILKIKP